MACHLFSTKPLSEPTLAYCSLDPQEQISVKFKSKYNDIHSRKSIWKCCLQNVNHFVLAPMCLTDVDPTHWHTQVTRPTRVNYDECVIRQPCNFNCRLITNYNWHGTMASNLLWINPSASDNNFTSVKRFQMKCGNNFTSSVNGLVPEFISWTLENEFQRNLI